MCKYGLNFLISVQSKGSKRRKRVLIVGAGAAGTAAAYSLGKHPDKFEVEIWERSSVPGTCNGHQFNSNSLLVDS